MTQQERERQLKVKALELEMAVATASQMPQKAAGKLMFPPFRTFLRR